MCSIISDASGKKKKKKEKKNIKEEGKVHYVDIKQDADTSVHAESVVAVSGMRWCQQTQREILPRGS